MENGWISFAKELIRFGGMVDLRWQGGGVGVRIGGSVVRRHEVGHYVDGHRENHLEHDVHEDRDD